MELTIRPLVTREVHMALADTTINLASRPAVEAEGAVFVVTSSVVCALGGIDASLPMKGRVSSSPEDMIHSQVQLVVLVVVSN